MTAGFEWLKAFPTAEAATAVKAIRRGWDELAARQAPNFAPTTREPDLTRILRAFVERNVAPKLGILGYWGAEGVENLVDFESLKVIKETRTDIQYVWNDAREGYRLVFEFKKLGAGETSRSKYVGKDGLRRFVDGPYSEKQAIAVMAAILTCRRDEAIKPLRRRLQHPGTLADTRMHKGADGQWLQAPSVLFPGDVEFDTEHGRPEHLGPRHGTIRVSHMALPFQCPLPVTRPKRAKTLDELESP